MASWVTTVGWVDIGANFWPQIALDAFCPEEVILGHAFEVNFIRHHNNGCFPRHATDLPRRCDMTPLRFAEAGKAGAQGKECGP